MAPVTPLSHRRHWRWLSGVREKGSVVSPMGITSALPEPVARLSHEKQKRGIGARRCLTPTPSHVNHPILNELGLCLSPKAVHHRPIDCGPAASHETTTAMDAPTVNILPGSGLPAGTSRMSSILMCKPFSQRRPVECLPHICSDCTTEACVVQPDAKAGESRALRAPVNSAGFRA